MKTVAKKRKKEASCVSAQPAQKKYNQLKTHYNSKPSLSRGILNDSPKRSQYQWFTRLLVLASQQLWERGDLECAHYYLGLALKSVANPRGGIVA